tara:strand:+ start:269 stop:583 length:315 start_codon:yes stop_codon:yes gene_type:complete
MIDAWHFHPLHADQEYVTLRMLNDDQQPFIPGFNPILGPFPKPSWRQKRGFSGKPKQVSPKKKYADRLIVNQKECPHCVREKKRIQTLGLVGLAIQDFMAENNE